MGCGLFSNQEFRLLTNHIRPHQSHEVGVTNHERHQPDPCLVGGLFAKRPPCSLPSGSTDCCNSYFPHWVQELVCLFIGSFQRKVPLDTWNLIFMASPPRYISGPGRGWGKLKGNIWGHLHATLHLYTSAKDLERSPI